MRKLLSWIGRSTARAWRGDAMAAARARSAARCLQEGIDWVSGERRFGEGAGLVMRVIINFGSHDTRSQPRRSTHGRCELLDPDQATRGRGRPERPAAHI